MVIHNPVMDNVRKSATALAAKYVAQQRDLDFGPNTQTKIATLFTRIPTQIPIGNTTFTKGFDLCSIKSASE